MATKKTNSTRATRTFSNEIRPTGAIRGSESIRLPRNIPGQGRKGASDSFGTRLKRT